MSILVIGGAGFIGRRMVPKLGQPATMSPVWISMSPARRPRSRALATR